MQEDRTARHDDHSDVSALALSLDASSDISGLTLAVQSLSKQALEVRVDIYNSFTSRWAEEGVSELFEALGDVRHLLRLEVYGLRIFPYQIPISMIQRTLMRSCQLEELLLVGIKVSGDPLQFDAFSETLRLHPSLKCFCLDNCKLENETFGPSLDDCVITPLTQIKSLRKVVVRAMEPCSWGTMKCSSVEILCRSPTLKELELLAFPSCCNEFLMTMANTLIKSKDESQLTRLSIAGSLGGLKGAKKIAEMLQVNNVLTSIEVHLRSRSEKDEAGIIELANSLSGNKTLTGFHLHGTPDRLGSCGTREAFMTMLESNYSLTDRIHVFHPGFLRPENEFYLDLNRRGRGRLFENDKAAKEEWVDALIGARHDLPCLFYFLSTNPCLCASFSAIPLRADKDTKRIRSHLGAEKGVQKRSRLLDASEV